MAQFEGPSSPSPSKQRKIALIVGQNNYQVLDKLQLSIQDAELIDITLKKLGFETIVRTDLTHDELDTEFMKLSKILQPNDIVFFYYSGHANQQTSSDHKTDNFLFGIDANTEEREGGKYVTRGIPLHNRIIYKWLNEKCIYLIVLDACRKYPSNNHQFRFKDGSSSSTAPQQDQFDMTLMAPGLPESLQYREYDFVFACQPGKGAIENIERSSGYLSAALSVALSRKGTWSEALVETMIQVKKESKCQQQPSISLNVAQKLYLGPKISKKSESPTLDVNAISDWLNSLGPESEIIQQILSTLQNGEESMPQKIQEPELDKTILFQSSVDQLKDFIKEGYLSDLYVEFKNRFFNIHAHPHVQYDRSEQNRGESASIRQFYCEKFSSTILIQGLKLVSVTPTACEALYIPIKWGYNIKIENCIFDGIGLEIDFLDEHRNDSSSDKNYYRPNIILNQVKVLNAPREGIKLQNFYSVYMNEVIAENCGQCGFYLNNTKDIKIQKANVLNSKNGIRVIDSKRICFQNVDVQKCKINAFEFINSQGSVIDCRYRNCFNGLIKSSNCIIDSKSLREV